MGIIKRRISKGLNSNLETMLFSGGEGRAVGSKNKKRHAGKGLGMGISMK